MVQRQAQMGPKPWKSTWMRSRSRSRRQVFGSQSELSTIITPPSPEQPVRGPHTSHATTHRARSRRMLRPPSRSPRSTRPRRWRAGLPHPAPARDMCRPGPIVLDGRDERSPPRPPDARATSAVLEHTLASNVELREVLGRGIREPGNRLAAAVDAAVREHRAGLSEVACQREDVAPDAESHRAKFVSALQGAASSSVQEAHSVSTRAWYAPSRDSLAGHRRAEREKERPIHGAQRGQARAPPRCKAAPATTGTRLRRGCTRRAPSSTSTLRCVSTSSGSPADLSAVRALDIGAWDGPSPSSSSGAVHRSSRSTSRTQMSPCSMRCGPFAGRPPSTTRERL